MRQEVEEFIASCPTCQKVRLGQGSMAASLHTTAVFEPWETIAIDNVGPLPVDDKKNKYILTIIDCFSKFVELWPAPDASAKSAAQALIAVFGRYGVPRYLRSDRGGQFVADIIQEFMKFLGVEQQLTLAHRPEANGIVERANGEVMHHLCALTFDFRRNESWSSMLPLVQRILNASPSSATGVAPARILFGDRLNLDRGLLLPFPDDADDADPETGDLSTDALVKK